MLHDRYLLVPIPEGLLLVDPRAAHLRVCYERALAHLREASGDTQALLFPESVALSPSQVEHMDELQPTLRALGFDVDALDERTVVLRGVPAHLSADDNGKTALKALLETGDALTGPEEEQRKQIANTMAQQAALPAGASLTEAERRRLLRDLVACEMPYVDPEGRPTLKTLPMEALDAHLRG